MSEFFFMSDAEAPESRDAEAPEQPRVRSIYERTRGRRFMRPIHTLVSVPLWASAPKARLLVVHAAFAAYWGFVNSAMALCLLEHYRQAMIVNARPVCDSGSGDSPPSLRSSPPWRNCPRPTAKPRAASPHCDPKHPNGPERLPCCYNRPAKSPS